MQTSHYGTSGYRDGLLYLYHKQRAMKKLLTILCTTLLLATTSCQHEDIWDKLNDHEKRIEQLEKQCRELNSNMEAIQTILTAVQQNDYVTEIIKVVEDGVEVGYSITFAKGGTITIYHGVDGSDGTNGGTPKIGVMKANDGAYYWTSDGEWMTDDRGNMIPATVADSDGGYIIPQFRVADGVWYVSYDNGNSWRTIEPTEEGKDEFFQNVTYDQDYVTLSDGSLFRLVNGYLTNKVTGEQEPSQQGYFYEYEIDARWRLYVTGYAAAVSSSSAPITYFDVDGRLISCSLVQMSMSH